jgi:ATP-binding cassette, subfamily B, multidrug efflux pump
VSKQTERAEQSGWRIVGSYIRQHWFVYLAGVTMVASGSLFMALIPRLLGLFTDRLRQGNLTRSEIAGFAGVLILISVVRVATGWAGRITVHRKGRILTYHLRRKLFEKWGTLSPGYYQRHSVGDLLSHALSDVEVVRELTSMGINVSVSGLAMLVTTLYLMAVHVDWRLSLAGLGPLLGIPLLVKWLGPRIRQQSHRSQEALGAMAQTVEEVIGGIRAVKAFGTEAVVIGRFERRVDGIFTEKMRFVRLSSLFGALIPLMVNLGFIAVLGYGGFLVIAKEITLGDFVAFTLYVAMLRQPLEQLGNVLNVVQRSSASLNRIAALLRVVPDVRDRDGLLLDEPLRGEIRVEGLSFRYPGTERHVLTDISFSVQPGRTLGIIGEMGSGKSTLADLLLRLYDPPEGTVFLDGRDIFRYQLARLREGIAYVPQDGFLFSTTILDNIGFSDEYPDRERAERCARITAIHDTISGFPEGFATEVGDRGVRLSGGQKQRIAIARMIYKDAPIQVLDDSLSAVDTTTERLILRNLRDLAPPCGGEAGAGKKTTIIISHRLSAVQHADEILVLKEGRIAERGNHHLLMALGGIYAGQWLMQSGEVEEAQSSPAGAELGPAGGDDELAGRLESLETGLAEDAA